MTCPRLISCLRLSQWKADVWSHLKQNNRNNRVHGELHRGQRMWRRSEDLVVCLSTGQLREGRQMSHSHQISATPLIHRRAFPKIILPSSHITQGQSQYVLYHRKSHIWWWRTPAWCTNDKSKCSSTLLGSCTPPTHLFQIAFTC